MGRSLHTPLARPHIAFGHGNADSPGSFLSSFGNKKTKKKQKLERQPTSEQAITVAPDTPGLPFHGRNFRFTRFFFSDSDVAYEKEEEKGRRRDPEKGANKLLMTSAKRNVKCPKKSSL